jgi:hypothetical protein
MESLLAWELFTSLAMETKTYPVLHKHLVQVHGPSMYPRSNTRKISRMDKQFPQKIQFFRQLQFIYADTHHSLRREYVT